VVHLRRRDLLGVRVGVPAGPDASGSGYRPSVRPVHLRAALAVWRYCEDSASYLFADGPPVALDRRILEGLRRQCDWTSKTGISQGFFKDQVASFRLREA
jgi:hypothetical protein